MPTGEGAPVRVYLNPYFSIPHPVTVIGNKSNIVIILEQYDWPVRGDGM